MGKLITKMVVMVLVAIGISNYGLYILTGQSPFSGFSLDSLSIDTPDLQLNPLAGSTDTAYKWVDEKGVTHYSNEPPEESNSVEIIEVDPDVNLIQSVEVPEPENNKAKDITPMQGPLYSPSNIQKVLDDAKNVEKVLQERHEQQEKLLKNL